MLVRHPEQLIYKSAQCADGGEWLLSMQLEIDFELSALVKTHFQQMNVAVPKVIEIIKSSIYTYNFF